VSVRAHEGVLHHVLGVVRVGQQMRGHAQAARVVAVDQYAKGVGLAGQHAAHQERVGRGIGLSHAP
jgi:hypothetical protein